MIEIATFKNCVGLFKDMLSLIDRRKNDKKEALRDVYQPLYDRLCAVATDYHSALGESRIELERSEPNLQKVVDQLLARREGLIIARDGVVGEASAFLGRHRWDTRQVELWNSYCERSEDRSSVLCLLQKRNGAEAACAYEFAFRIIEYFWLTTPVQFSSPATTILDLVDGAVRMHGPVPDIAGDAFARETCNHLRRAVRYALKQLEEKWVDVTYAFTNLKMCCLT